MMYRISRWNDLRNHYREKSPFRKAALPILSQGFDPMAVK